MDALASMMMVDTLSSRISLRSGVGSRLSSNILTDSVSLEMRKPRTSSSNRSKPEGAPGPMLEPFLPPAQTQHPQMFLPLSQHGAAGQKTGEHSKKVERLCLEQLGSLGALGLGT